MPQQKSLQTNFSAGELSPDLAMRQDAEQYRNGAKSLLNRRCLIGGGTKRRPGSIIQSTLTALPKCADFIVNQTTQYVIVFGHTRMDAFSRNVTTGALTAAGSLTGCPWTALQVPSLQWVQSANTIFVVHPDMAIQVVTRTGASSWSRAAYAFTTGPAGRLEQPYLKIAVPAVTLAPSALTGSITLTVSSAWFTASHVGCWIRYLSKACLITAFAVNGLSCTATVVETLPQTVTLDVASSANFAVGEVVEGATSGARGQVTAIPDGTHLTIVIIEGLTIFAGTENIVGPNGVTAMSATAGATPAAVTNWDEQIFSAQWGYPSTVEIHRNRLCFAGHRSVGDYLFASAFDSFYDFNVGSAGDADAIIESIGDGGASKIVGLHSGEQLILTTDRGPYYVPENSAAPFTPSRVAFFPFGGTWPFTATARMVAFDGGILGISGSTIIKMKPTGDLTRAWDAEEVSFLNPDIIATPTQIAVTSNYDDGAERYAIVCNSDGTLVALMLVEAQRIRNLTPWHTTGTVVSVLGINDTIYAAVQRDLAATGSYVLERFDPNVTLDAVTEYANEANINTGAAAVYGTATINVVTANLSYHLGEYPLTLTTLPAGPYHVGLIYDSEVELLPPAVEGPDGPAAGQFMRIVECYVDCLDSARFAANGHTLSAYQVTDDVTAAPPVKTGPQLFKFLGWRRAPTITINQPDPLPLHIRSVRTTVVF